MRQQQVASSEGAPASVTSRKVTVKNGRREDLVGEGKLGDCLKLGNRRVLVKIPGNRLKVTTTTTTTPQSKAHSNDHHHHPADAAPVDDTHIDRVVEPASDATEAAPKRPSSDGPSLPQWGQRKRLRNNNRGDVKPSSAECGDSDVKPLPRSNRGSVKAEKSPTVRIKRPAVVPKPAPELTSGDFNKRTDGAPANGNHLVTSGAVESSEPTTSRVLAEAYSERPVAATTTTPEVPVSVTTPAEVPPPAAAAATPPPPAPPLPRPEENAHHHQDKAAALSEKVDMDLFQWPKFIVSLTRKEKEDDFFLIKGTKLPVRPKKRTKHLEKVVTFISPGAWLCDITRERYEVKEKKTIKKRPRGLKAMGSADSDTD